MLANSPESNSSRLMSIHLDNGYIWNPASDRVASITHISGTFEPIWYFQLPTWKQAEEFAKDLTSKNLCSEAQPRIANRFESGYEVKVRAMAEHEAWEIAQRWVEDEITLSQEDIDAEANYKTFRDSFYWMPVVRR